VNLKKNIWRICSHVIIPLIAGSLSATAGNTLKIVHGSSNSLDIQLANDENVTGIQFCLRTTSGIALTSVKPGNRTADVDWIVDSYRVSDSAVNVLILNGNNQSLTPGHGIIASILYNNIDLQGESSGELCHVMVIDGNGDSLGVEIANLEWNGKITGTENEVEAKSFLLDQNYPNPFNPSTMLTFRLNAAAQVRLSVFDISGREVIRLIDRYQNAGSTNVEWDSNSSTGQKLASGIYIARLTVGNKSISRKMLLTK